MSTEARSKGVIRLTTPTTAAPESVTRARTAIGTALGYVWPKAVPLRDGRVWLTSRRDVLPASIVRGLEEQLSRRAADRASDDRMLAEAVGVLGAEVARVRGESPETGAADALDRLLRVPGLDQSRRTEGEAMLRLALRLAARDSVEAAVRLAALPGAAKVPVATEIVAASRRISHDATALAATGHRTSTGPRGRRRGAPVGVKHRRPPLRQTLTREIPGTGLAADGPAADPHERESAALAALTRLGAADLGSSVTGPPTADAQSRMAVVPTTTSDEPQYVRVEIRTTVRGLVAQGRIRSGTATDPHVLRIDPGLSPEQYGDVWVHQLSQMTQQQQAARADRPSGVLGRLRAAFRHERRDHRINADLAVYRKLSRDWQSAREGRPNGPLRVQDLERDLEGLATAIERRSGARPQRPWANDSTYSPGATAGGLAGERAAAAAIPEPNTAGHLRQQVTEQIAALEAAVADLETKAEGKTASAADAVDEATSKLDQAVAEDLLQDIGAPERARRLRVDAENAFGKGRRHVTMAHAYQQAATDAGRALAGYQTLLAELDNPDQQPGRWAELAREAAGRSDAYEASLRQALPVDHLETGVPTDERLRLPVGKINEMLSRSGSSRRIADHGPIPAPMADYRLLFSEGMVFTVDGDPDDDVTKIAQVRVRMKARDLSEVTGLDYTLAEQMSGTLGEGGQSNAITATHSSSVTYGLNLQPFLALAPDGGVVSAMSQVIAPKVEATTGTTEAVTAGASAHAQLGWVDVFKGESIPYRWLGEYEIEVRGSATEPWSPVETVDAGEQLTWVPSPYTVPAPTETVTLEQLGLGDQCTEETPRLTVNRISGLGDLNSRLVAEAREQLGPIDRVGHDQISQFVTKDPLRLLAEQGTEGGLSRTIPVGGGSEYELTLEAKPIWRTARLVGESSAEMGQEKVQVDFAGVNAGRISGASLTGSASLAYPGKPLDPAQPVPGYLPSPTALSDLGSSTADLSPSVSVGRNVSRQGGQSVSTTAITPVVDRDMSATQGALVDVEVTATLRKIRDPRAKPVVVTATCEAKVRLTPNRLLRAGAPAGEDAVLREDDGTIRTGPDGRALLAGDPEPPSGRLTMPPWHGRGPNQLRGTGKSLPDEVKGADEARDQALARFREMGLVPPLHGKPTAAQVANRDRVIQDITDYRLVAGMNTACQSGLVIPLVEHRTGHAPRTRLFRLSVTQDFDDITPVGTTASRFIARLGISSRASQQTSGRSKSVPLSAGVGVSNGPAEGQSGLAGRLGLKLSRSAIGRSFSWTLGRRVNRVTLNESTAEVDLVRQGIRITVTEMTDHGDSEPLADVQGSMVLPYDSSLARAEAPVFATDPKPPHAEAVSRSIPVAVDAGEPADRLFAEVDAIRADTTGYLQLHAALSSESLVSNTEWITNGRYELPLVITPPPANPAQAVADRTLLPREYKVVIRSTPVSQTFAALNDQNTANINFTMNDVGHTSGTSTSGGVSVDGSGGAVTSGEPSVSGTLGVGRVGGTSQSTGTSQTTGDERLRVNNGVHYELIERHRMVAEIVHDGKVVQTVALQDALLQKTIPEYEALELYAGEKFDLPPAIAADVAERYLTGKVEIPKRVATGFVRRYKQEQAAGATTGLAAGHTAERLNAKILDRTGVAESTAPTAEERLKESLVKVHALAESRRVVGVSEQYEASLASSQLYMIKVDGDADQDVDLLPQLKEQLEEVAPGLLASDELLAPILDVDLAKDSYQGQLENMLGPRGYTTPIEVPVEGQDRPDLLLITVKAEFVGEPTVDGTPELAKAAALGFIQKYKYFGKTRSISHTTTYSGSVGLKGDDGGDGSLSGGVSTDRVRQVTAGSSEQNTTLARTGDFEQTPLYRTMVFTTEVRRIQNAGAAALASVRWRLNRTAPAAQTLTARPRQLRAELTALVPTGVVGDPPAAVAQPSGEEFQPEHRSVEMPEGAAAEAMRPFRKGEAVTDELYDRLTGRLGRRDLLGPGGLAQYEPSIGIQLQPTAMQANLEELTSPGGLRLEPMATGGNGRTTVGVRIHAKPVGWQLVTGPAPGQSGTVRRGQEQSTSSTTGTNALPLTATGGVGGGIVSVSGSVGDQVKQQSSNSWGTRRETTAFRNGDIVTVRVPVEYRATIDRLTDKGRGTPAAKRTTQLKDAGRAEFYVRMQYHEYLEGLRQLESGGEVSLGGSRLRAVPEKLGKPDLRASEWVKDASGKPVHQPYRPLRAAIEKAIAEETTVVLSVTDADGNERLYQAFEDGTMDGGSDGGFATAFATLDRNLVMMAEDRVDLRELFNTSEPGSNFSTEVAAALEEHGVPKAMLKGLTYSSAKRENPPTAGHGTRPTTDGAAAGRAITQTAGGGPILAGP
ncbi:hypothetical protein AB0E63_27205 [Kribbella sp. NPDC026596]|uniref:hypothetical protein n=1 Tax=Kribbella sp. NPDC026596 TaxID=3155122 RepID=UPI00340A114E